MDVLFPLITDQGLAEVFGSLSGWVSCIHEMDFIMQ